MNTSREYIRHATQALGHAHSAVWWESHGSVESMAIAGISTRRAAAEMAAAVRGLK